MSRRITTLTKTHGVEIQNVFFKLLVRSPMLVFCLIHWLKSSFAIKHFGLTKKKCYLESNLWRHIQHHPEAWLTPQEQHGDVFYTLPLSSTLPTLAGIMSCCQSLQWLRVLEDVTRASADQSVQQKNNIWGEDLLWVLGQHFTYQDHSAFQWVVVCVYCDHGWWNEASACLTCFPLFSRA